MQTLNQTTEQVNYLELIKTQSALELLKKEVDAVTERSRFYPEFIRIIQSFTSDSFVDIYKQINNGKPILDLYQEDNTKINHFFGIQYKILAAISFDVNDTLGLCINVFYNNELIFTYHFNDYYDTLGEILSLQDSNYFYFLNFRQKIVYNFYQVQKNKSYDLFMYYLSNTFLDVFLIEEFIKEKNNIQDENLDRYEYHYIFNTKGYVHNDDSLITIDNNFRDFKLSYKELLNAPSYYKWFYYINYNTIFYSVFSEQLKDISKDYNNYLPKFIMLSKNDDLNFTIEYVCYDVINENTNKPNRYTVTKELDFTKDLYSELKLDDYNNFFSFLVNTNTDWQLLINNNSILVIDEFGNYPTLVVTEECIDLQNKILDIFDKELFNHLQKRRKLIQDIHCTTPPENKLPDGLYENVCKFIEFLIFKR